MFTGKESHPKHYRSESKHLQPRARFGNQFEMCSFSQEHMSKVWENLLGRAAWSKYILSCDNVRVWHSESNRKWKAILLPGACVALNHENMLNSAAVWEFCKIWIHLNTYRAQYIIWPAAATTCAKPDPANWKFQFSMFLNKLSFPLSLFFILSD